MQQLRAIRGMPDILPSQTPLWQHIEHEVTSLLHAYAYREIRFPLLEPTELFQRSIGEVTDIVEKEMYTFTDRNGDSLTLRPEGTAGCVRAVLQNGLLHTLPQRLWYLGPMFRHERPQMGRQRQFHQIGVESFGLPGPDIEAEHLLLLARLWRRLGIDHLVTLEINSLGSSAVRANYREALIGYLAARADQLDEDSRRRLGSNPLRILDTKDPGTRELLAGAPQLTDHLDEESREHMRGLRELLDAAGIAYRVNPALVRGLDYYGKTVYEWVTDSLGAQGTVCAGGRYDGLVEQLGGTPVPGVGFAMGLERLVLLLEVAGSQPGDRAQPHAYWVLGDAAAQRFAFVLAERLRDRLPWLRLQMHCGEGRMKAQMKKADRSGATLVLIVGEEELAAGQVSVRGLREGGPEQSRVGADALADYLAQQIVTR
ncbi:MAG: histidine--tRNA ligase [Gammaproteobacteria bacterium]|nr:histidine--tRNA ligase [Gammaproteobacteria bacterium]MBK9468275.1 histidine--tRNA ligase [Gammaproteobacteria bacterium]